LRLHRYPWGALALMLGPGEIVSPPG
jgi:hypothetical protein